MEAVVVTCPNETCGARFRVSPEHLGRSGHCRKCGTRFVLKADVPPAEGSGKVPEIRRPLETGAGMSLPRPAPREEGAEWREGNVVLGVYEIRQKLGQGGMGAVFRVRHRGWGIDLAVKRPLAKTFATESGKEQFVREAETWANLGIHPHTVTCHFVRSVTGIPTVFAEFVDGGDLAGWIRNGPLYEGGPKEALRRVLDVAIQFAWGLHYAHACGLVHEDVKPGNVMMTSRGIVKVTDFGLARAREVASLGGARAFTPGYCSPEQKDRLPLSHKTDIWSWAASIAEMFIGMRPWAKRDPDGSGGELVTGHLARASLDALVKRKDAADWRVSPPQGVIETLRDCLRQDERERPDSLEDVAGRLVEAYESALEEKYPRGGPPSLESAGSSVVNLNNRAISMIELGHVDRAAELLERAETGSPLQEVAYNRCRLEILTRGYAVSSRIGQRIPSGGDEGRHGYYVGMLQMEAGDIRSAIESLGKATKGAPKYQTDAFNARGIALLLAGERRPAILSFLEALRLAPDRLDIRRNLAMAYYYDGKANLALRGLDEISRGSIMESDDLVRYAAALSAAGLKEQALQAVGEALRQENVGSTVKLTAAELLVGAHTFLPGVTEIGGRREAARTLAAQVAKEEPANLRAQVDKESLPEKFAFRPKGSAMHPSGRSDKPSDAGGCVVTRSPALARPSRWGSMRILKLGGLGLLSASILGIPFNAIILLIVAVSQEASSTLELLGLSIAIGAGLGLGLSFLVLLANRKPVARLPVPTALVSILMLAFILGGSVAKAANAEAAGQTHRWLASDVASAIFIAAMCGVFFWIHQWIMQFIVSRMRAGLPLLPIRRWEDGQEDRLPSAGRRDAPGAAGGAFGIGESKVEEALRASRKERAAVRWRESRHRLVAALHPWFWYLLPQILMPLALALVSGLANINQVVGFILTSGIAALVLGARYSPAILRINGALSLLAGLLVGSILMPASTKGAMNFGFLSALGVALCVTMPPVYFFLNMKARELQAKYSDECSRCAAAKWDIRQVIDPLDIRRYAAPWQIMDVRESSGGDAGASGRGGPRERNSRNPTTCL